MSDHPPCSGKFSVSALASQFSLLTNKNNSNTPACGIKAKNWKFCPKNNFSIAKGRKTDSSNSTAMQTLPTTSSDPDLSKKFVNLIDDTDQYDAPWDGPKNQFLQKLKLLNEKPSSLMTASVFGNLPSHVIATTLTDTHKSIGSQSSSTDDSGIYDEPWDSSKLRIDLNSKSINTNRFGALVEARTLKKSNIGQDNQKYPSFQNVCGLGRRGTLKISVAPSSNGSAPAALFLRDLDNSNSMKSTSISADSVKSSEQCPSPHHNSSSSFGSEKSFILPQKPHIPINLAQNEKNSPAFYEQPCSSGAVTSFSSSCNHNYKNGGDMVAINVPLLLNKSATTLNRTNFSKVRCKESSGNFTTRNCDENNKDEQVYDEPWEFNADVKKIEQVANSLSVTKTSPSRRLLSEISPKRSLSSGEKASPGRCVLHSCPDSIDATLAFDRQPWYHGSITRVEAERRLQTAKLGAFLIRCCEAGSLDSSDSLEYALSLKTSSGLMHMKIQRNQSRKWILGYFSYPFESITRMVTFYKTNKLPIKGADHICLQQPVVVGQ